MERILCKMCGLEFRGRYGSKTCSPRCRKRRDRIGKGKAIGLWPMNVPPNSTASKLWR